MSGRSGALRRALVAAIFPATLVVAACTQQPAGPAAQASGTPVAGGTVTIPIVADPTLTPWSPNAFIESLFVNRVLFDGLTKPGKDLAPAPDLAASSGLSTMSLKVKATSSAVNGCPSLHYGPSRSLNVHERPSADVDQLAARSGAGARSLPGFVSPSKSTRLTNSDSMNAVGLQGFRVGSATLGIVTVPPATGVPDACAAGPAGCCVHAATTSVAGKIAAPSTRRI